MCSPAYEGYGGTLDEHLKEKVEVLDEMDGVKLSCSGVMPRSQNTGRWAEGRRRG